MKIREYSSIESKQFSGSEVKGVTGRVIIGKKDGAENFCMRIFEISPGGFTPKHSHAWEHEIFVHRGEGVVFKDGEWVPIKSGTTIFIQPEELHQMKNTGEDILTFVCLIPSGAPEI